MFHNYIFPQKLNDGNNFIIISFLFFFKVQSKLIRVEMINIQDVIASDLHQTSTKQNPTNLVPRSLLSPSICQHSVWDNHRGHT